MGIHQSLFCSENRANFVYRAYRMPYEWVPDLDTPEEVVIQPVDVRKFRVPGSECKEDHSIVEIKGTLGYHQSQLCVTQVEEPQDENKPG